MSGSEGRGDVVPSPTPQTSGLKVLETLKKHVFEGHTESPSKTLSSREVCSSFSDLTATVFSSAQRSNNSGVISGAIELLVHACSSHDRAIRLAGQENLHKLVKKLQSTHLSRLQQDLFHELKKNGDARSLGVALDVFSALFPHTKPSRRQSLSQSLLPVLMRLLARDEEGLNEALQEALVLILPTLTPFLSINNTQLLMSALLGRFHDSPASYRRMSASTLHLLSSHAKSPQTLTHWLVGQMLVIGCNGSSTQQTCQGILLTLQNLTSCQSNFTLELMKKAYGFVLSCMLYRDGNTSVAAMETLNAILLTTSHTFHHWLISDQQQSTVVTQFWTMVEERGEEDETREDGHSSSADAHSLREDINDAYFDSDHDLTPPETNESLTSDPESVVGEFGFLVTSEGSKQPLASLVQYLREEVLSSQRVSAVSVGLACLTSCADLSPSLLSSLSPYIPFSSHSDPKLKSRSAKLLAVIIKAVLRENSESVFLVCEAASVLGRLLADSSPVVLKAVCESLRICLPSLAFSSHPQLAVDLVQSLLVTASSSSYWLAKVELLRTLSCLPLTALALSLPSLPQSLLSNSIFPLLADNDHRVRAAAAEALAELIPSLQLTSDPVLAHAHWEVSREFPPLQGHTPHHLFLSSVTGDGGSGSSLAPLGLPHILWFLVTNISSSENQSLQRGCLETLHVLCSSFPPASFPQAWGCQSSVPSLLPTMLSLLTSLPLAWTVHGQQQLLDVCSAIFLSCSLSVMDRMVRDGETSSSRETDLSGHANHLLRHVGRLLAVFVHILEGREPETRETKRVSGVSPRKAGGRDSSPVRSSPGKAKVQIIENLQKPPLIPRDGLGQFASLQTYLKLMDNCRSAYTNFQVSLGAVGDDKFSRLLQSIHNMATTLFEVAIATDVSKHVEELMTYFTITFQVDPSGALLCVQQLLNALFGMNVAAQHSSMHSPYLSSLPFQLHTIQNWSSITTHDGISDISLSQPLALVLGWLEEPPPLPIQSPSSSSSSQSSSPLRKRSFLSGRRALVVKPVNSVSSVKDYIGHFEPLVVNVVKRFPHMSSILLQQRTLFLLIQLLQLKVRYELLDCNHTFLESVLKLVSLLESGVVKDGESLVPFLFQFLVLLAYDNSQLVTIPEVMQRCDGVMASGQSVDSFAIPALQPLVLNIFVTRPSKDVSESETEREVVLSMLLRVIEHSRVLTLLTHVLDCFNRSTTHWHRVSGQILASLLNGLARLSVVLDTSESMTTLYHLFSAMDPSALSLKALFVALLKQPVLKGPRQLCRWLAILNSILALMHSVFPETTVYSELSSMILTTPTVKSEEVEVDSELPSLPITETPPTRLAWFLLSVLRLSAETERKLKLSCHQHPQPLLPNLIGNCILLTSCLLSGEYVGLREAFSSLSFPTLVIDTFLTLTPSFPLLTLHFCQLSIQTTSSRNWVVSVLNKCNNSFDPSFILLNQCLLPLVTDPAITTGDNRSRYTDQLQKLMNSDLSSPKQYLHVLQVARDADSAVALPLLCNRLVGHPLSAISGPAVSLCHEILRDDDVTSEMARDLVPVLKQYSLRYPELVSMVHEIAQLPPSPPSPPSPQSSPPPPSSHPLQSPLTVQTVNKLWYLAEVYELCLTSSNSWLCGRVLARLSLSEITELLQNPDFPKELLEVCLCQGVELSFSSPHINSSSHPLLQASSKALLQLVVEEKKTLSLLSPLLWCLLARERQLVEQFSEPEVTAILDLISDGLENSDNTLTLQISLDCLSLFLSLSEIQTEVNEKWLTRSLPLVCHLIIEDEIREREEEVGLMKCSKLLCSALNYCLTNPIIQHPLTLHIRTALLSLARLPSLHSSCLIPPLLISSDHDSPSEQVLDQALLEGEVLQQYMTRSNSVGWLDRPQFEERWMQLLGVVNQPPPPEGMPVEEVYAYSLNMCVGLVGVVSLLAATSLRPHPGNPVFSIPLHTHRNRDILFLGTKPGRSLSHMRWTIEKQIMIYCGARPNVFSHYQCPLLSHLSLPLFTRNLERGPGDTRLAPAQLSLRSLWPVTLANPTSPARHSDDGVDVRSCVLSLVDLFSHWISQPIHPLLLYHTLRSILMVSDIFSLSSQFDWMLQLTCDLSDKQPLEDCPVHSLAIHCVLKAAAVVKVDGVQLERVVKVTERAITSDFQQVQEGCLCGLLYVLEDPGSQLAALLSPSLAKYLPVQLEGFHRHSERHIHLCWSLAVTLGLHHTHLLKDAEFATVVFEKSIPLLLHPHTSTVLFHSLCLGLELLVLNFALSTEQRSKIGQVTAGRITKCDLDKMLPALGLLVSCMYSGEQVSEETETDEVAEASIQIREHLGVMMEHLRHGPLPGVQFLVDLVPGLMVDFLPPVQVLQMVVTEFVSPHQPRPSQAALVMAGVFSLLISRNYGDLVTDWVLLSLDSFVQQEPEQKAVWCLVCLLTAASPSPLLQAMSEVAANQQDMPLSHLQTLLATTLMYFSSTQVAVNQQKLLVEKFLSSNYTTLNTVAHACLHSL